MQFKERYHRFRFWQKEPRHYSVKESGSHRCACCNNEFEGNYCPVCGQAANVGRITWQSLWKNVTMLWGMDSHSMPYSLWQLLWRPGYFISEYLSGKRQVSYPPVKMLFVLAVFYAVVRQFLGFDLPQSDNIMGDTFRVTVNWLRQNPGWAMMGMTMFFSIPTWFFFRFAPRHPQHTFPEGLFIQLFMATLMLICLLIEKFIPILILLIPFYYYITYRQLFGYRFWGTLWRLSLAFFVWALSLLFLATIILMFSDSSSKDISIANLLEVVIIFMAILSILLFAGYWISKRAGKTQSQKADTQTSSGSPSPKMVK